MENHEILALGKFSPSDLIISVSESNRKIDSVVEGKIDAIWEAKKKKAEAEGRICYNGISYRLNSLQKKGGRLVIDFGTIEFKAREALPTITEYADLSEEYYRKGCYCCASIKTSDNKYLMVELSGKSMNSNATDLLGGIMEKPMEINTGEQVFNSLYVELEEEGRIRKSDIKEIYLRAIFLGVNTNIGFYFDVTLNVPSIEILDRFANEVKDQDIKSLKVLSYEEYLKLLNTHNSPNKRLIPELMSI